MRLRPEHLAALRAALRSGTPERVLGSLREQGIAAEIDPATRVISAPDSRGFATRLLFREDGLPAALVEPSGREYRFEHDAEGLLVALVHPGGERLEIGYDADANVSRLSRPHLCRYDFTYGPEGRLTSVRFPDELRTELAYDDAGQLATVTDRAGATTRFHRRDGRLEAVEDPLGRRTVYEADEQGALSAVVFPDGSRQTYAYDPEARVAEVTTRDGARVVQELDEAGTLRAVRWEDGSSAEFDFDGDGNLASARSGPHEVRNTFDSAGNPLLESTRAGEVRYAYDGDGRLVELVTPHGDALSYEYDEDGRIGVVRDWEGRENRFVYAPDGTLAEIRYGNGVVERQRYARLGRLRRAEVRSGAGDLLGLQEYAYDVNERLISATDFRTDGTAGVRRTVRLAYDAESRLVEETVVGRPAATYGYDRKGNLVSDGRRTIEIGPLDEPTRYGPHRIDYDGLGNARSTPAPAGRLECSFRANGLLDQVHIGEREWRYDYDAFCRRLLKTDGLSTWRFGWTGHQLLWEEYEAWPGAEVVRRDYLWAPDTVTPLAFRENGRTFWLQSDARGAVIRAFGNDGRIVWSADYDSFGRAAETVAEVRQPWRLLGQYHDQESGLHYNFARYYNPATRSYLSRDPYWFLPEATNYSYARNDPWNRADPFGTIAPLLVAAGVVALGTVAGAAIGAAVAAATGGDPIAGAVAGGLEGFGAGVGFLLGGPVGSHAGSVVGGAVGAFAGSVVEETRKGHGICWPCATQAAAFSLSIDAALGIIGKIPGVNRLAGQTSKNLGQKSPIVPYRAKKTPVPSVAKQQVDFVVTPQGTAVPVSQSRMKQGFDAAGFPKQPTRSPGTEYRLPDGRRVRAMDPSGGAPRRASFENAHGHAVTPDGVVPQPPRGLTRSQRLIYLRDRTHVKQTR